MAKSIQADAKRGRKTSTQKLQAQSLKGSTRNGMPWEDDEVERLVQGIEANETTFIMAQAIGRSYYGTMGARAHVAFALRHSTAIWGSSQRR